MRVAFFTETFLPKIDGIVVNLTHLLDHLEMRGHDSIVFAPRFKNSPKSYANAQVVTIPATSLFFYPELRMGQPFANVDGVLEDFDPDLIHLVNPTSLCITGLRAAGILGVPVVASYHTDMSGFAADWNIGFTGGTIHRYYRWIHNQCDLNFTPSEFTKRELEALDYKRIEVWKGAVDIDRFSPAKRSDAWRQKLTSGQTHLPLIIFVSRLSKEKRPDWLLPLMKDYNDVRLAFVGDGPYREELEQIFRGTNTVFTGYLTGDELASAYAAGDLFVFNGKHETFGNVVLEAMSCGLPAVVPDCGGVTDSVRHGYNGLQYPADDQHAMVAAARSLIDDPQLRQTMGQRGRAIAETRTWEITLDEVLDYYQRLIDQEDLQGGVHVSPLLFPYEIKPLKRLRRAIRSRDFLSRYH